MRLLAVLQTCHLGMWLCTQVSGMTCSACCATVEATLDALPGVINAVVSLIQQQARVDYAASVVSPGTQALADTATQLAWCSPLSSSIVWRSAPAAHHWIAG